MAGSTIVELYAVIDADEARRVRAQIERVRRNFAANVVDISHEADREAFLNPPKSECSCPYCQKVYEKAQTRCDSCGAPRRVG